MSRVTTMRVALLAAVLTIAAFGAATSTAFAAPATHTCDSLDPHSCLLPWPNNHFTYPTNRTATGLRLNLFPYLMPKNKDGVAFDPAELNRSDGFSPGSTLMTFVPGLDLKRSGAAKQGLGIAPITDIGRYRDRRAAIVLLDAFTRERQMIWSEVDPATGLLLIHPARNLVEGHRYIAALRDLKNAAGARIKAGKTFRIFRDRLPTKDQRLLSRRAAFERSFRKLAQAGVERTSLFLTWTFTVASTLNITERAGAIRDDAFTKLGDVELIDHVVAGKAPAYRIDRVQDFAPCAATGCEPGQDAQIARRVDGTLTAPCYLNVKGCPPGSRFRRTPSDVFQFIPRKIPFNTMAAPFTCVIPRAALAVPARATLFGHDVLGSPEEVAAPAMALSAQDHDFAYCATRETGLSDEDKPMVLRSFSDLSKLPHVADRLQQGFLNFMLLGRLMIHPDGFAKDAAFKNATGGPVLAPGSLFYEGDGQGALFGGALTALEPDYERAALDAPSMNLSTILARGTGYDAVNAALATAYPDALTRTIALNVAQPILDRGEANGYARHMTRSPLANSPLHNVLLQVAVGDHRFPQITAETLGRTAKVYARRPVFDPGRSLDRISLYGIEPAGGRNLYNSIISVWDSGPVRLGGVLGTPIAPITNVAPRDGVDPRGLIRLSPAARSEKSDFLKPGVDGQLTDECAGRPCHTAGHPY